MKNNARAQLSPVLSQNWWQRSRGLLGTRSCPDQGMLFPKCKSIHTFGMRYSIDVVYLNHKTQVLAVEGALKSWSLSFGPKGSLQCLELPAHSLFSHGLKLGTHLHFRNQATV